MAKSLFSSNWHRVAEIRPQLRSHAEIHRQRFRGQVWYVLQDRQSGRFFRVSPAAHYMICMMDGRRTMEDIWVKASQRYEDDPPTQDETIQLLAQLHNGDLLRGAALPNMSEISERASRQQRRNLMSRLRNPLALRFPLIDPDSFLDSTVRFVRPLFTRLGFLAWLAFVGTGAVLAVMNWEPLTANLADRVLVAENILLLLISYPIIKALHELGHGYAAKVWGGEVHEMGIMLLVLFPIPYVDASSSSAFREKWRRAVVGAAGIMVELVLASAAMILWLNVEVEIWRAIAFNVMLIGGVSTLLFNGNPLLRFDGYYVLCDLIEIPNLGTRANKYVMYLVQTRLLGIKDATSPATAPGERLWFVVYAVSSFIYRLFVMMAIALFIATKLFFIGVALALWAVANVLVMPVLKGLKFLFTTPKLARRRPQAVAASAAATGIVAGLLFLVPLPYATVAQGVVWTPEEAGVRAGTHGLLAEVIAEPNSHVEEGQPLLRLVEPTLELRVDLLEAELRELRLRHDAVRMADLVEANMLNEQIRHTEADLELQAQRREDLVVRSPRAGRFILPHAADLPGRFVRQGQFIGYVVDEDRPAVVRVAVPEATVDLVRQRLEGVAVRLVEDLDTPRPADVLRQAPAGTTELPSPVLSSEGGGPFALDPRAQNALQAFEKVFLFDVRMRGGVNAEFVGNRAYVRFDHGTEALAWRTLRALRQLFLSRFDV